MASVLLVEDEPLIRMMVAAMLTELGHSIADEASDLASGLRLATEATFDAAVLDVQLGAHSSEPIGQALQTEASRSLLPAVTGQRGYLRTSGTCPSFKKPFQVEALERCMASLLANIRP